MINLRGGEWARDGEGGCAAKSLGRLGRLRPGPSWTVVCAWARRRLLQGLKRVNWSPIPPGPPHWHQPGPDESRCHTHVGFQDRAYSSISGAEGTRYSPARQAASAPPGSRGSRGMGWMKRLDQFKSASLRRPLPNGMGCDAMIRLEPGDQSKEVSPAGLRGPEELVMVRVFPAPAGRREGQQRSRACKRSSNRCASRGMQTCGARCMVRHGTAGSAGVRAEQAWWEGRQGAMRGGDSCGHGGMYL